jgi:proton glutamate symport protein
MLPQSQRLTLIGFFQSIADAMIVIVQWVLALPPIGVFGLSLSLGLNFGLDTLGVLTSGLPPLISLRALLPILVMAASTPSSLATLPAMLLTAAGPLKVPVQQVVT